MFFSSTSVGADIFLPSWEWVHKDSSVEIPSFRPLAVFSADWARQPRTSVDLKSVRKNIVNYECGCMYMTPRLPSSYNSNVSSV